MQDGESEKSHKSLAVIYASVLKDKINKSLYIQKKFLMVINIPIILMCIRMILMYLKMILMHIWINSKWMWTWSYSLLKINENIV